jgi:hypothetical protein
MNERNLDWPGHDTIIHLFSLKYEFSITFFIPEYRKKHWLNSCDKIKSDKIKVILNKNNCPIFRRNKNLKFKTKKLHKKTNKKYCNFYLLL